MSSSTLPATADNKQSQQQTISIDQLGIDQLSGLQQQIDKELTFFSESLGELKDVQTKFMDSGEAVASLVISSKAENPVALIPLTESMYVKGCLTQSEKVLVDIGTGYYAEMSLPKAVQYFKRKQEYLGKQMEVIEKILPDKRRSRALIMEALQTKVQAAYQQQQQQSTTNKS